jgi:hypothetical protein
MAQDPFVYNNAAEQIGLGNVDWVNDTLKVMFVTASYVANRDHVFVEEGVNDANQHEIVCTGYTGGFAGAGRKSLASKTITQDDPNDRVVFDAADFTGGTTWSSLGNGTNATIAGAIVIKEVTADTDSLLICYLDFTESTLATNSSDVDLTFHATNGVFYLSTV